LPLVVTVMLGVAVAFQLIRFVNALVEALIVVPLTISAGGDEFESNLTFSRETLSFRIGDVPFSFREVVSSGLALLALLLVALLALRLLRRVVASCPDCGSLVPVSATVCHACTADLGPPTSTTQAPDTVD